MSPFSWLKVTMDDTGSSTLSVPLSLIVLTVEMVVP